MAARVPASPWLPLRKVAKACDVDPWCCEMYSYRLLGDSKGDIKIAVGSLGERQFAERHRLLDLVAQCAPQSCSREQVLSCF